MMISPASIAAAVAATVVPSRVHRGCCKHIYVTDCLPSARYNFYCARLFNSRLDVVAVHRCLGHGRQFGWHKSNENNYPRCGSVRQRSCRAREISDFNLATLLWRRCASCISLPWKWQVVGIFLSASSFWCSPCAARILIRFQFLLFAYFLGCLFLVVASHFAVSFLIRLFSRSM